MTDKPVYQESECPFCRIVAGKAKAKMVRKWPDAIAIVPLNPVTIGHVLVIPRVHVERFSADPWITGIAARRASFLAEETGGDWNLIISEGAEATQTVPHIHAHLVPRRANDGLRLPWSKHV